ncbi:MAG: hypothetical protein JKY71_07780 [Alphaproteobacteria bacterium]|nr:hypothetical protein [Alphaproteobacteria bacterium]
MRTFLTLVLFFTFAGAAYADDAAVQKERAVIASNIFAKACFMMHSGDLTEKRIEFLDSQFPRFEDEKKGVFLDLMNVENGTAWAASFPKGNFVVVVDSETTNCHVIAQKADAETIHGQMKKVYQEAEKNLEGVVIQYRDTENIGSLNSSGFEIKTQDGEQNLTVVAVSTPVAPDPNKPEALMTLAVE